MDSIKLEDFLIEKTHLSADEIQQILRHGKPLSLKKGELFSEENTFSKKIGLLRKGILYSYYYDEKGERKINQFFLVPDNYIVVDYESYMLGEKSRYTIAAIDYAELLVFDADYLISVEKDHPDFLKIQLEVANQKFLLSQKIIELLQIGDLKEQLKILKKHAPEILEKVPYSYIASYLGVHRNTLTSALKKI